MDCQSDEHTCDEIYGECRCYADVLKTTNPGSRTRFVVLRKKGYTITM